MVRLQSRAEKSEEWIEMGFKERPKRENLALSSNLRNLKPVLNDGRY